MARSTLFGREPALWIGTAASVLSLGTAVGLPGLSEYQVAAIVVALNAVAALFMAWQVRPIGPAIFTNVVGALAALGTAYGFNVPSETVGAVNFVVISVLTLLTRGQVSPAGATTAVAPPAAPPTVQSTGRPVV
jgi:hypothetical protein